MYNLPDNVTQAEIDRCGSIVTDLLTMSEFLKLNEDITPCESDAPQCVQDYFNDVYVIDLMLCANKHPDDDRPEMWDEFCVKIADGEIRFEVTV